MPCQDCLPESRSFKIASKFFDSQREIFDDEGKYENCPINYHDDISVGDVVLKGLFFNILYADSHSA